MYVYIHVYAEDRKAEAAYIGSLPLGTVILHMLELTEAREVSEEGGSPDVGIREDVGFRPAECARDQLVP